MLDLLTAHLVSTPLAGQGQEVHKPCAGGTGKLGLRVTPWGKARLKELEYVCSEIPPRQCMCPDAKCL